MVLKRKCFLWLRKWENLHFLFTKMNFLQRTKVKEAAAQVVGRKIEVDSVFTPWRIDENSRVVTLKCIVQAKNRSL